MIYECPKCGVRYEIDQPGEYQCSQCNQVFIVEPEPEPQPMKIAQPVHPVQPVQTTEQKQHTIICPFCKSELPADVKKCSHCGEWLSQADKPKSLAVYLLLSFFFGHFGVAEFYAGRKIYGCLILVYLAYALIAPIVVICHKGGGLEGIPAALLATTIEWFSLWILQFIMALINGLPLPEYERKRLAAQAAMEREKRRLTGKGKILVAILLLAYVIGSVVFCYMQYMHIKNIPDYPELDRAYRDVKAHAVALLLFSIPAWLLFAWIARKVFPRKQLETSSVSLSEIAYNQDVGQESGVQALRRKFAEESMQNGPAGFAKYNGKWVPMHRDKLSLLAYVLLGLITITAAFGVHLFYARCKGAATGMICFTVATPFACALHIIHPLIPATFMLSFFFYWFCTLLYGWEEIKKYNGD
jgi:hypothetical protein